MEGTPKRDRRLTVGRLMVAVAVFAPVAAIGAKVFEACQTTGFPGTILAAIGVTGSIGLLALRKPLIAIPFVFMVFCFTPKIATFPRVNYHDLPSQGAMLAWSVGASVGWSLRLIRKGIRKLPHPVISPEPFELSEWLKNRTV